MNTQELDLSFKELNIKFAKGNDRSFKLAFTSKNTGLPVDLTGCVFSAGLISPIITFDVLNSNPSTGIITITIPASATSSLSVEQSYKWFLSYVKDTFNRTLLKGVFKIV